MQGGDNIGAAQVGCQVLEVWGPVHAAAGVRVAQADIVHVDAVLVVALVEVGHQEQLLKNFLARGGVDVPDGAGCQFLEADTALLLELLGNIGLLGDQVLLVGEVEVGLVLLGRRDPAVADEQALEVPLLLSLGLLVAVEDVLGDVGNVLASKRFASKVELQYG